MNFEQRTKDRPIFITGGDGFVGSHVTELLVDSGADVSVFIESAPSERRGNLRRVVDDIRLLDGDLRDYDSVRAALSTFEDRSDLIIIHLGAQSHVGESWNRPHETIETNVIGTLNVLHNVVELDLDVSKIVTAGSSEEYGNLDPHCRRNDHERASRRPQLHEGSPLNPKSVYATTKVAADFLTMNYHDAYGLPAISSRMFNNFGPRQSPRFITGTVITQALERDFVELGNLDPERDMCFVRDGARGHLHIALAGSPGQQYVFGYGQSISMREWTNLILDIGREAGYWGDVEVVQRAERYRPGRSEVTSLTADYTKLHEKTGWEPEIAWEDGLRRTIAWYDEHRARWVGSVDWSATMVSQQS